jgi:hypothetical protein
MPAVRVGDIDRFLAHVAVRLGLLHGQAQRDDPADRTEGRAENRVTHDSILVLADPGAENHNFGSVTACVHWSISNISCSGSPVSAVASVAKSQAITDCA